MKNMYTFAMQLSRVMHTVIKFAFDLYALGCTHISIKVFYL